MNIKTKEMMNRIIRFRYYILLFVLVIMTNSCRRSDDNLYQLFKVPPAEARPFVRWWWNGDCVEENEIKRELNVLNKAGIGGVEINPIAMPVRDDTLKVKPLVWLSPEWNKAVKVASETARQNGMRTDLIVGSGWPFGGEFLKKGETIQRVIIHKKKLSGPAVFQSSAEALMKELSKGRSAKVLDKRILFLSLVPENISDIADAKDMISSLSASGEIKFDVPEGNYTLIVGIWQEGYRNVTYGAPGSDGPVLDHYNATALRKYLDRLSEALENEFGTKLGDYLWALFCDSIELDGANWTTDFSEQFYKLCGYKLEPYFPFVFYVPNKGYEDQVNISGDFADKLQRVRYDYNRTLVTLFLDRFTKTFNDWCHENGVLSRYQAYGNPWLVGISEGYTIPDIPESNNWLFSNPLTHGFLIWNKYASSSGHVAGKPIVSCEAMTNLWGVFKASLGLIKQADDMNFITGINHSVLHGFNYSPPAAGFPGWVRFGTYFSEQNTWWPYFKLWTDYNSRLSAVFQASKPCPDVAILGPTADVWSQAGLWRPKFYETPWYCYQLWKAFNHNGLNADYVNESMIQKAAFEKGKIRMGDMTYRMIVLTDVESIQPATAKSLREYAKAGGKIVFINRLPGRSPSFINFKENDDEVQKNIREAMNTDQGSVRLVNEPAGSDALTAWAKNLIDTMEVIPAVSISDPMADLYQVHYRYNDQEIFFFSNQNDEKELNVDVKFKTGNKIPWKWNPENGEREVYRYGNDPGNFSIKLRPVESLLLVFDKTHKPQPSGSDVKRTKSIDLDSNWSLQGYRVDGEEFQLKLPHLTDLGMSDDSLLNTFSGRIEYRTTIDFNGNTDAVLDLGKVKGITEVTLNGMSLGERWYGDHLYPLKNALQEGTNELTINLTTTLFNYCRTQKDNPAIRRWIGSTDPVSSGLTSPVRIYYE